MATSTDAAHKATAPTNEMKVELNLSWFTKGDKPLISLVPRDHRSSSSSSSSSEEEEIPVINPFEKWLEVTRRKEITLVAVGRAGVGKSTLIRNLLRLSDKVDLSPPTHHSPSPVTTEVKVYTSVRAEEGITIRVFDVPALCSSTDVNDNRVVAELQEKTEGRCDMLLYCVSLLPDSRIDKEDKQIIDKLTRVFGQSVWNHLILVLTFANAVKDLYPEQTMKDLVDDYGKEFQSVLGRSFSVVSIYSSCEREHVHRDPSTIVALPAGRNPDEQYVDDLPVGWDETVFLEVLNKCNLDCVPNILQANAPKWSPYYIRMPLMACEFVVGLGIVTVVAGWLPAGLMGHLGEKVGYVVHKLTGRMPPPSGLLTGYALGLTMFASYASYHFLFFEYWKEEKTERELEEIQGEILKYRSTQQAYCLS